MGWAEDLTGLQQALNDAAISLPVFDVRKAQGAIDQLAAEAQEARARIAPTRKFTFRSRAARAARDAARPTAAPPSSGIHPPAAGPNVAAPAAAARRPSFDEDEQTVEGVTGQVIVVGALAAATSAGSIRLLNLVDCVVVIEAATRAIRVDGLTRCFVVTGPPVDGSVLLHDCTDCIFMLASRQIRIHRSTG